MSLEYLEDLESSIERSREVFACPGATSDDWYVESSLDKIRVHAQRLADTRRADVVLYRLVDKAYTTANDFFLVAKKILEAGPRGEPRINWSLVGTREAAELVRDVSNGPTPYFGVVAEETFSPKK